MTTPFHNGINERFARSRLPRIAALLVAMIAAGPVVDARGAEQPTPVAVVDFAYRDTSGEPKDQTARHRALLLEFMRSMRDDLARSGRLRVVSLACEPDPCSLVETPPEEIMEAARRAGARLLFFGGVHKMSTLVQWAKVQAVDLRTDKVAMDRLVSFRGDTEEAWRRAEAFIVEQIESFRLSE